jgi:ubiquinone/menaquinone biosynthesis C-methylase UbiE
MNQKIWTDNLHSEINFWNRWAATKGIHWKDEYLYRINPNSEVTGFFKEVLQTVDVNENYKILDVGAGPITILGKFYNGIKLNITAVDALAESFNNINWQDNKPEIITQYCETEKLSETFEENSFDLVHARNTLDHHYDVLKAFKNMLYVTKKGGLIIISHTENEANNNKWDGLHKWNFFLKDEDMKIQNLEGIYSLKETISKFGNIISTHKDKNSIINVIMQKS